MSAARSTGRSIASSAARSTPVTAASTPSPGQSAHPAPAQEPAPATASVIAPLSRTWSLSRAELIQFFRNPTLLVMGIVFPAAFALAIYAINHYASNGAIEPRMNAADALEKFTLLALTFIQYYAVLSATTTRRDDKVLKRLRTGESTDINIIVALCVPGAALATASFVVFVPALAVLSGTVPRNIGWIIAAVIGGLVVSSLLALVTASYTKNAESAQVTSLPVIALAMASQAPLRSQMPESVSAIVDKTPFAAISDLVFAGWLGGTEAGATDSGHAADVVAGGGGWGPLIVVTTWCIVSAFWARRVMRWDTHRG